MNESILAFKMNNQGGFKGIDSAPRVKIEEKFDFLEIKSHSSDSGKKKQNFVRYYENTSKIKCSNCKQIGHSKEFCLVKICNLCLGDHLRSDCANIFKCFTCGDQNHNQMVCPHKKSQKCYKCHKVGHDGKKCGFLVFNQEYTYQKI